MPPFKVRDAPNGRFKPGTRPPAGKTCRLYKMHDWLQPWSVITYEMGWHPNLTIGGHTVLTFGCLLDVSCKNARRFYKNSSPGHTNTVYKMGPQLVYDSSWQQVSPVVRPDPARNQQKSRCVELELVRYMLTALWFQISLDESSNDTSKANIFFTYFGAF